MDRAGKTFYGLFALLALAALGLGLARGGPGGLVFAACAVLSF